MKKIFFSFVLFFCALVLFAHTPLLTVEENGDGTIFVQGGFSNGASAGGVKLYLTDAATGEKLYEGEFPDTGELNLEIPAVPYNVTFDAGPGHVVTKEGPPPPGGFGEGRISEDTENNKSEASGETSNENSSSEETVVVAAPEQALTNQASSGWVPMDTVAAMPKIGPSFTAILALILSVVNLALLVWLLRKVKR